MPKALIIQPAGLGDIIFTLKIASKLIERHGEVLWPIIDQYSWILDYIKMKGLSFISENDQCLSDKNYMIYNLQSAGTKFPEISFMDAKYKSVGIDYSDWHDYFHPIRNIKKEADLYNSKHVKCIKEYNLICNKFASPPYEQTCDFTVNNGLPNIYINNINGITPFDWMALIECAETLHFVDTCFTYIVEKCHTKNIKEMVIYSRNYGNPKQAPPCEATKHLFKKKWEWRHVKC